MRSIGLTTASNQIRGLTWAKGPKYRALSETTYPEEAILWAQTPRRSLSHIVRTTPPCAPLSAGTPLELLAHQQPWFGGASQSVGDRPNLLPNAGKCINTTWTTDNSERQFGPRIPCVLSGMSSWRGAPTCTLHAVPPNAQEAVTDF